MYFDAWSTSYFFWVVICFAVWGLAGFSVYGAINVFTSKRKQQNKKNSLTLAKIQELKQKVEKEAEELSREDILHESFEREKKETVKKIEEFVNARQEDKTDREKQQDELLEKSQKEQQLKAIYEKELALIEKRQKQETEEESTEEKITLPDEEEKDKQDTNIGEDQEQEDKTLAPEQHKWQEIDEVFRIAFRG